MRPYDFGQSIIPLSYRPGHIAEIILNIGMDFIADSKRLWNLTNKEETPITVIPINELTWLFNYPFLGADGGKSNLKPRDVIKFPKKYSVEYKRVMDCDLEFPIHVMRNRYKQGSRLVILDGLHRLMKAYTLGETEIKTHILPRSKIPFIKLVHKLPIN